jgi:DNA-directed RNA polymerase specialized sigma24 family protein
VDDIGGTGGESDPDASWPLPQTHYQLLVRLAALLTGDPQLAETIAAASCGAVLRPAEPGADSSEASRRLQREIVMRSRRAGRQRPIPGRHSRGVHADASDFASLPVVTALRGLPARAREALVLTYYLDLTEQQAAAIAGISTTALRRNLAAALSALPADLPGD